MNDIAQSLREFVAENFLFGEDANFANNDSFLEQGIIDSTGVLELVTYLEEQLEIAVDDDELVPENLDSIDNLCRFIASKRGMSEIVG